MGKGRLWSLIWGRVEVELVSAWAEQGAGV